MSRDSGASTSGTGSAGANTRSPVPTTGLPVGVEAAPLGKRLAAQVIDIALPVVVLAVLIFGTATPLADVIGAVVILAWLLLVWRAGALRAATPGMRVMKLQLVGLQNGRPVGWGRFFLRELVLLALTASVVGLLVMLVLLVRHPRRQGWHDLLADTVSIKQRRLAPAPTGPAPAGPVPTAPVPAASSMRTTQVDAPAQPPSAPPVASAAPTPAPPPVRTAADDRKSQPAPAAPKPPASRPIDQPRQTWFAVLDDGRQLRVDGLVLLGRSPQARPGEEDVDLIKVADDSRTVSKTHLALGTSPDGLYVMDRGSTNGSTVTNTAGISTMCPAGEMVPVPPDAIVSFGDHWLRVERRQDG